MGNNHEGCVKIVSISALANNYRVIKRIAGRGVQIFPVVKARAYGHGAVRVARELKKLGAEALVVAQVQEALELKSSRISGPVIVMGGSYHGFEKEIAGTPGIIPAISSISSLRGLNSSAKSKARKIQYHLKVDTGMHRLGLDPVDLPPFIELAKRLEHIELEGLLTHLSSTSTKSRSDMAFTRKQLELFNDVRKMLNLAGYNSLTTHAANSGAIFLHPSSYYDAVRPGLCMYGVSPIDGLEAAVKLKPVMGVTAKVTLIKKLHKGEPVSYDRVFHTKRTSKIAAVSMGYEDGVPRSLTNKGAFLIRGKRARIVGSVTMDTTMVDVTNIPRASVGDEAVFIGKQGRDEISAAEVADKAGLIPYEVLCGIGERARLVYSK